MITHLYAGIGRCSISIITSGTLFHTTLTHWVSISWETGCWRLRTCCLALLCKVISIFDRVLRANSHTLPGISVGPSYISGWIPRTTSHACASHSITPGSGTPCRAYFIGNISEHIRASRAALRIDAFIGGGIPNSIRIAVGCSHAFHCIVISKESG